MELGREKQKPVCRGTGASNEQETFFVLTGGLSEKSRLLPSERCAGARDPRNGRGSSEIAPPLKGPAGRCCSTKNCHNGQATEPKVVLPWQDRLTFWALSAPCRSCRFAIGNFNLLFPSLPFSSFVSSSSGRRLRPSSLPRHSLFASVTVCNFNRPSPVVPRPRPLATHALRVARRTFN